MAGLTTGAAPQHAEDSLPALPPYLQSETHLTAHLASRFHLNLPTAKLSSHGFLAFNTYTTSTRAGPNGSKDGSAMAAAEELAVRAWTRLGARGENQAVLFLGESGSGKTTVRSHLLSSILALSSTPLSTKLSYAAFLFDSLTTTKSITAPTASKAGLFYELQYDTTTSSRPTLIGGKLLGHRLERRRLASVPIGERSFHILYYLLAGTSAAEKHHLGLEESSSHNPAEAITHGFGHGNAQKRWRYLGHPTQLKVGINDAEGFQQFKTALRNLEFPRNDIAEICQVLATIMHIGQLEFISIESTAPAPDESGGYSHEGGEQMTVVKNRETLTTIAAFLGVSVNDLETSLSYKSQRIHKERVTIMLDPKGARKNADELAQTLYSLLVTYIIEQVNQKVCAYEDAIGNTISIVDFPGFAQTSATTGSTLDQLLNNAATESIYQHTLRSFYEEQAEVLEAEEISVAPTSYFDNSDAVRGLLKSGNGLLSILDDQMKRGKTDLQFLDAIRRRFDGKNPAIEASEAYLKAPGSNFASPNPKAAFTVKHWAGEVEYPVSGLMEENADLVSGDVVNLIQSSRSDFVRAIFGQQALQTVSHPHERTAVLQATLSSKPARKPSVAKRQGSVRRPLKARPSKLLDEPEEAKDTNPFRTASAGTSQGAAGEFLASLATITETLSSPNTNSYFVFCLKPNDRRIANQFDSKCVRNQLQTFGIPEMSQRLRSVDFSVFLPFGELLGMTAEEDFFVGSEREKAERVLADRHWPENEARAGSTGVLLSERCWAELANIGRMAPTSYGDRAQSMDYDRSAAGTPTPGRNESRVNLLGSAQSPFYHDEKVPGYLSRELDGRSEAGFAGDMFRNLDTRQELAVKGNEKKLEEVDDIVISGSRKRWMFLVWMLTFFVPDFLINKLGRIKRKDIRTAWREKLAINMLIWAGCGFMVFFIVFFPELICPHQYVYTNGELSSYDGKNGKDSYVAIRGVVFDLSNFAQAHYPSIIPDSALEKYAGKDATNLFPVQVSAMCQGVSGTIDPAVQISYQSANYTSQTTLTSSSDPNARYHDFRWATGESNYRPTWFTEQMLYLEKHYYKGNIGYPPKYIRELAGESNYVAYMNKRVYDLTSYVSGSAPPQYPPGQNATTLPNSAFMDQNLVTLFTQNAGQDLTQRFQELYADNTDLGDRMQLCLDNLFFVGKLDTRSSPRCQFAQYFLLAISCLLASVIGFKFLAALQFGGSNMPENLDRFIMCTVPAYTEDENSLRRAIDSAAKTHYDDKRKLLVVICDGMIIGQGNDRPTPRIVLDILGVPEDVDPEPLSFESLGEGQKQHNMGKVYSGLYEVAGHVVPFMVIVKIGKPSEVSRPGNRGKRDSQMILMRFLNRVHYNLPMTPLELEMHHQIRNIIGVNPTFYEFLLQIDADTVVAPDSATRFVAAFLHDTRLIAVCGETALSNAKHSLVTMMQVYEYYISHNLTKAFESLFGSVTCLPGCFTMVRIRDANTGKPLFVSKEVVEDYSEIRVDTLHMKNLLHLGEDRYLTTLLLKYHPSYKTKYIFRAHAWTIAPESWKVFFSQRRRWINSTVHNLIELIPLQQLCGFFCFSMRFVVFLDLMSTIVQPVIVGYIAYLIYLVIRNPSLVPVTAFILIGAIYGLQAIIFILRRKWEMIGWMIIYVAATPVFACILPLVSFWQMDDFSWGNTRLITGENGRQVVISDEGKFDPASIPKKRWEEYQAELLEAQSQAYEHMTESGGNLHDDTRSQVSGMTYATKSAWNALGNSGTPMKHEYNVNTVPYQDTSYSPGWDPQTPLTQRLSSALSLLHPAGTSPQPPDYPHAPPTYNNGYSHNMQSKDYFPPSRPMSTFEMSELKPANNGIASRPSSTLMKLEGTYPQGHVRQPSDDALLVAIKDIVSTADLMTVTKKSVREALEQRFGLPAGSLEGRKAYIGQATEAVLAGQL